MGIKYVSGYNLIPEAVREFQERVENATVYYFSYMGEKLAKYAKEMHSYTDRTGNLTNSIGYAVVKGGKIINTGGMMGSCEAKAASLQVLQEMMDRINHQFALIIIAGMEYASYVEAKGYNVIMPAELKAKAEMPAVIQRIKLEASMKAKEQFGISL